MKKLILFLILFLTLTIRVLAVNINDIDAIVTASYTITTDADRLLRFSLKLKELRDKNFEFEVADSTQVVNITNAQKQGLLVRYNELKAQLQADINQLP